MIVGHCTVSVNYIKIKFNFLLAILFGAFGGVSLAFFLEYLGNDLERVEDVEECLQLPVLASIPDLKNKL